MKQQELNKFKGDFISVMCADCDKRYKENNNLGPKYVICLCSDIPRELDLSMAEREIG